MIWLMMEQFMSYYEEIFTINNANKLIWVIFSKSNILL